MHPQIIIDHIRTATNKSRLNRRRRTAYQPSRLVTSLAALVGVSGILVVAYLTTK
jgi:hypothetical protein